MTRYRQMACCWCCFAILALSAACRASTVPPAAEARLHPTRVPALPPDSTPHALFDSLGTIRSPGGRGVPWIRSIVIVVFKDDATQAERQAAIDSIGGVVVGGFPWPGKDGNYYVRIPGSTSGAILDALTVLHRLPQVDYAAPFMIEPQTPGL